MFGIGSESLVALGLGYPPVVGTLLRMSSVAPAESHKGEGTALWRHSAKVQLPPACGKLSLFFMKLSSIAVALESTPLGVNRETGIRGNLNYSPVFWGTFLSHYKRFLKPLVK